MNVRRIGAVLVAGGMCFGIGRATARQPAKASTQAQAPAMGEQTRKNLDTAMHGEALAFAKYQLFAQQARREGHPEIARIFEQAAHEERFAHFAEEAHLAGLVGSTQENLQDAMRGEAYEMTTMYPQFAQQAKAAGDMAAADRFEEISRDEQKHHDRFEAALKKLQSSKGVGGAGNTGMGTGGGQGTP